MKQEINYVNISFRSKHDGDITKGLYYKNADDLYKLIEEVLKIHDAKKCFIYHPFYELYQSKSLC